jgi:hypothetical protein
VSTFGVYAGLLGAAAAAFLTLPQWRVVCRGGSLSVAALILPVIVLVAAAAIYPAVSTWRDDPVHTNLTLAQRENPRASVAGAPAVLPSGPEIRLAVSLGPDLVAGDFGPAAALFLFARSGPVGPPVAVLRENVMALPGDFVLTDEQAMLPGSSLADFKELRIVARVSLSGEPTAQAGDYYGEAVGQPGSNSLLPVVIDRVVE